MKSRSKELRFHFHSDQESYDGSLPARLLVEMYRENMIDYMFIWPEIVPRNSQ